MEPGKESCAQNAKSERLCGIESPARPAKPLAIDRWSRFWDALGPPLFLYPFNGNQKQIHSYPSVMCSLFCCSFQHIFDSILSSLTFLAIFIGVAPLVCHSCYKHCLDSKPQCLIEFEESCLVAASQRHSLRRSIQTTTKDFPGQRRSKQNKLPEMFRDCRSHRLIKSLSRNSHSLRISRLSSVLPAIRPLLLPRNGRNERSLTILMLDFCRCRRKSFFTYSSTCLRAVKSPYGNLAPVSSTFIQRHHFTLQVTTNSILSV